MQSEVNWIIFSDIYRLEKTVQNLWSYSKGIYVYLNTWSKKNIETHMIQHERDWWIVEYDDYGNTGCRVFKIGIQNKKYFLPKN